MFDQSFGEPNLPTSFALPTYRPDRLTHILLGDYAAVVGAINQMDVLHYCDRVAWIAPVPTGRSGEYISVMTRRIAPAEG
ncbi:hypothetical protein PGN35_022270 [Nodosilinea sp. PGN35]|uniref:hypothetical protein n=1 Tax=Nodosilinea sp. PGN35 TaxID=3020489 RepID=UPI0023B210F2|nr:hypothetical protein [Nodosilinea sp. TSF1-S3]MDF0364777.1 hypothetical protein [Nodosilinea sp. TSF1-S3]